MKAIQQSLDVYYYTNNSTYPQNQVWGWRTECNGGNGLIWIGGLAANDVIVDSVSGVKLVPQYMASFPSDPTMNKAANTSCYLYLSNGIDYKLLDYNIAELSADDLQRYSSFVDPKRSTHSWQVSSPGGRNW